MPLIQIHSFGPKPDAEMHEPVLYKSLSDSTEVTDTRSTHKYLYGARGL